MQCDAAIESDDKKVESGGVVTMSGSMQTGIA